MPESIAETVAGGPSRIPAVSASTKMVDGLSSGNRSAFSRKVCPVVRSCRRKVRLYGSACCNGRKINDFPSRLLRMARQTHSAQGHHQCIEVSLQQVKSVDQVSLSAGKGQSRSSAKGGGHNNLSDSSAPQPLCDELCISHESLAGPVGLLEVFRQDASEVGHVRYQG